MKRLVFVVAILLGGFAMVAALWFAFLRAFSGLDEVFRDDSRAHRRARRRAEVDRSVLDALDVGCADDAKPAARKDDIRLFGKGSPARRRSLWMRLRGRDSQDAGVVEPPESVLREIDRRRGRGGRG